MSPGWKRNLLLRESFDFIPDDVDATANLVSSPPPSRPRLGHEPFVRCVQLQNAFLICVPKQLVGQAVYARRFTNTGHALRGRAMKVSWSTS